MKKLIVYYIVLFPIMTLGLYSQEQSFIIEGVVYDKTKREPLPGANIVIVGTYRGTTSNNDGQYRIVLKENDCILKISYIGYENDTIKFNRTDYTNVKDVYLTPKPFRGEELTVYADENPAIRVMKNIIKNKQRYLSQLKNYEFEAYSKTVIKAPKKKNDITDTIIGGILENQTRGYWQSPDDYKEIIFAKRQTENFSPANNVLAAGFLGRIPNFNDEMIRFENYSIVGPTAANALDYYDYRLLYTSYMDTNIIHELEIIPKSKSTPLFEGYISINENTFSVIRVDVKTNQAFKHPLIKNLQCRADFDLYEKIFWLPKQVIMTFQVSMIIPITFSQTSVIHDYKINHAIPAGTFDDLVMTSLPEGQSSDTSAWNGFQVLPLNKDEISAYRQIDSIIRNMGWFRKSIISLAKTDFSAWPVTSFEDFYRFNRVEGSYIGVGIHTKSLLPKTIVTLKGGFGLSDKKSKWEAQLFQYFNNQKNYSVNGSFYDRLNTIEDDELYSPNTITWSALLSAEDYKNYYRVQGWQIGFTVKPFRHWSFDLSFKNERHSVVTKNTDYTIFYPKSNRFRDNLPIHAGRINAAVSTVQFDTRKYFKNGWIKTVDISRNFWRMSFKSEFSDTKHLNSGFFFRQYVLKLYRHQLITGALYLDVYGKAGMNTGSSIPFQKWFFLESDLAGYAEFGAFRTMRYKEFSGNKVLSLSTDFHFGNYVFRKLDLPKLRDSRMDFILINNAGWTNYRFVYGKSAADNNNRKIFYETGFGLSLMILRIDLMWRITDRRLKKDMVVVMTSSFGS